MQHPLTKFSKALELRKHSTKVHHKTALVRSEEFVHVMRSEQPNIKQRIDQAVADNVSSNREMLTSIVNTIMLCCRQNIALHGNFDNITDLEIDKESRVNHGNFWALEFQSGSR